MKKNCIFIFIFLNCLICLNAQNKETYKGFDFYFSGGMYKGNTYHATYYNGNNEEINIGRILSNKILKDRIDNLVSESGVILDNKGIYLSELPEKMHYEWRFAVGLGLNYYLSPNFSLSASAGQVKLKAKGTAVFSYNKGVVGNRNGGDYLMYPLIGEEKRSYLEFGFKYTFVEESRFQYFINFLAELNSVEVENADLYIENNAFTMIDYYGGAKYDPTINQTRIDPMLGGVGFGATLGLGIKISINEWFAIEPAFQIQYSRLSLGEYKLFKPSCLIETKIVVRDKIFTKN